MGTNKVGGGSYLGLAAGLLLVGGVATAQAQLLSEGSARIIEWDVESLGDLSPGAMVVDTRGEDNNRVWFITRLAGQERVYRVDVGAPLMKNGGAARATAWTLDPDLFGGGIKKLRPSHDRRFVVVRTSQAIQELDTQACVPVADGTTLTCDGALRVWRTPDFATLTDGFVSDIAVDDNRRIFITGTGGSTQPAGFIQMLVPTNLPFTKSTDPVPAPSGTVFRWTDDGVNQCGLGASDKDNSLPCNSGIDVRPSNSNVVYVSNQGANSIDELNLTTNTIRRWPMPPSTDPAKPIRDPRQLKIDSGETIWVTTGSGHLVSLKVNGGDGCPKGTNRMTRHTMPGLDGKGTSAGGWGIGPDSNVVGYTDSTNNKVGMLLPHDGGFCQTPQTNIPAPKVTFDATAQTVTTVGVTEPAPAAAKTVLKQTTRKQDGTYVEAVINVPATGSVDTRMVPPDSVTPLGITPVKGKGQGTFFYTVGFVGTANVNRFGFVRLGIPERINNPRDDDDSDDGFKTTDPTWNVGSAGDADGDGVPDQYDTNTSRDNTTFATPAVVPVGQSWDYPMSTTPTTLALIAAATPDSPTATIAIDVYNSIGTLVGTSGPIVGAATATVPTPAAGNYTIRVRNLGTANVTPSPAVVVREPLIQQ